MRPFSITTTEAPRPEMRLGAGRAVPSPVTVPVQTHSAATSEPPSTMLVTCQLRSG